MSPFKANVESTKVSLYTYMAQVTRTIVSFDKLDFYTMTAAPRLQQIPLGMIRILNLFASALYLASTDAVNGLCGFLGVCNRPSLFESGLDIHRGRRLPKRRVKTRLRLAMVQSFQEESIAVLQDCADPTDAWTGLWPYSCGIYCQWEGDSRGNYSLTTWRAYVLKSG